VVAHVQIGLGLGLGLGLDQEPDLYRSVVPI
jgi:hypothetical protein